MRRFRGLFLLLFLLLPAQGLLRSQDYPSWDDLLDRYERICRMCLDLKDSDASDGRLLDVLAELESLKEEFKGARDRMPAAARRRYELIRRMYASGKVADTRPQPSPPFCSPLFLKPPVPARSGSLGAHVPMVPKFLYRYTVSASALVVPEFTPGLRFQWLGGRVGAYAGIYSNFSFRQPSYQALSDGTADGLPVWTSGVSSATLLFVAAGPAVRITDWLSLYCGAGFGMRRLFWEDSEGQWMEVSDISRKGLSAEIGAGFNFGRYSVSAGVLAIPSAYGALSVSVGYNFGAFR